MVGLVCTLAAYTIARRYESAAVRLHLEEVASDTASAFQDVLEDQIEQLEAVVALFEASRSVEPAEFRTFTETLLRTSYLKAIEWIPRVSNASRAAFETARGGGFTFKDFEPDGKFVRARGRDEYFPVYYLEPLAGNEVALGLDLSSEPRRREALEAARDSGELSIAGPLTPAQLRAESGYYLLLLPRYARYASTPEQRRLTLAGFVAGLVRLQDLLDRAAARLPPSTVSSIIRDGSIEVAARRTGSSLLSADLPRHVLSTLAVAGHSLLIETTASEQFVAAGFSSLPRGILVGGATLTVALAVYVSWLATVIARQRRTQHALRETEERYRSLIEQAPEAIAIVDANTLRFLEVNPTAERLLKRSRDQILQLTIVDVSAPVQARGVTLAEAMDAILHRLQDDGVASYDWVLRDATGNDVYCESTASRLVGGHDKLFRLAVVDVTQRRAAEERQRELLRELDHRVKNCFATVLALADQAARATSDFETFHKSFSGRVRAMARAHEALAAREWKGASLESLITLVLAPFGLASSEKIRIHGASVVLAPQAASATSMIVHELATNATKYGALSGPRGGIDLDWAIRDDGSLYLVRRERNVARPQRIRGDDGFGTRLMRGLTEHELGGTFEREHREDGLWYRITLGPQHVSDESAADESAADPGPNTDTAGIPAAPSGSPTGAVESAA
jgi:PAS domain S-box-containing protein